MSRVPKMLKGACPHCGGDGRLVAVNPVWLRTVRKTSGVLLRELARKAGFSAAFLCDVEHGRRNCNAKLMALYEELATEGRRSA